MGIAIPPLSSLAFILSMCTALSFNISTPDYLALPMVLALALGYLGAFVEYRVRIYSNVHLKELARWAAEGDPARDATAAIAVKTLLENFAGKFLLFCASFAAMAGILRALQSIYGSLPRLEGLNWHILLIIAAVGGLLGLRVRHAFVSFTAMAAGLIIYIIL